MTTHRHANTLHQPRVIDGDTLEAWCEISHGVRLLIRIRLPGIECGELGTPEGERGRILFAQVITQYWTTGARLANNPEHRDQYGRIVSDILFGAGKSAAAELLKTGHYWLRGRSATKSVATRHQATIPPWQKFSSAQASPTSAAASPAQSTHETKEDPTSADSPSQSTPPPASNSQFEQASLTQAATGDNSQTQTDKHGLHGHQRTP